MSLRFLAVGLAAALASIFTALLAALATNLRSVKSSGLEARMLRHWPPIYVLVAAAAAASAVAVTTTLISRDVATRPQEKRVVITSPSPDSSVGQVTTVRGTASNLAAGDRLWILIAPQTVPRLYPQNGPVSLQQDGSWISPSIFLGTREDVGEQFTISVVIANVEASRYFELYLAQGVQSGNFPGIERLPNGANDATAIVVMRR